MSAARRLTREELRAELDHMVPGASPSSFYKLLLEAAERDLEQHERPEHDPGHPHLINGEQARLCRVAIEERDRLSGALAKVIEAIDEGIVACTVAESRALYDFQRASEQGKRDGLKRARDLLLELQVKR